MVAKLKEYDWKLSAIDEMIAMAKDYYMNPNSKNAARWKALKRNVKKSSSHQIGHTEHRRKLGSLPDYLPLFTYFIIFAQLVSFIVIYGLHGVTLIGVEPKLTVESGIQTFMGMETIHKWTAPNVWIGPSEKSLIGVGGVFAPCMRTDLQLQFEQSKQNYSTDTPLGCCEVSTRNVAGTTTQAECDNLTEGIGKWNADVTCNKRPVNKAGTRHNMKPCCLGLKGQCRLMSHKHCAFLGGEFYLFGPEHCSQVMCLENICHPGRVTASGLLPWQPDSPAQWWRVPLSLLYHHGIIQFLVVMVTQWFLLTQIEVTAGWFRMLIIYIISGTMALLTSSIMLPYEVHVGGMGAVCGMLGVVIIELFHFWKLVDRPWLELLKLSVAIILLFLLGTLPYLDIFGMITGLISGALCGVIFLPYVTFGKWHCPVRVILIVSASGLLILICYFLLHLFVAVQSLENCEGCKKLNCVPYTEKMCDTSLWHQF
ncbi:inactive rhomboid protein 1-like [Ruditapes philippinarum]|uniref:inactive rhomboid protein 1-like n=1 Tax=Ruditapes philippinarum TaxID=129788 RepID=UPI00295B4787|nr:inactive rhomboid protein 1-like [Ruditapes philippinarum]